MKSKTTELLSLMKILSWIIFIGLCIKTGAILISFGVSLFVNEGAAENLYLGLNLSGLHDFSMVHYVLIVPLLVSLTALKAYLFFLVTRIFSNINLEQPFSLPVSHLISRISYIALGSGLIAMAAFGYSEWLAGKGLEIPIHWNASEFLFMAGIIFVIALLFQRGIEIQSENELTI